MSKKFIEKLDQIVEGVFARYDTNGNGFLQFKEIQRMLCQSFERINRWRGVSQDDVKSIIEMVPYGKRDKIDRQQVKRIFKNILTS